MNLFAWNSCCLIVDLQNGIVQLSVNGQISPINKSIPQIIDNRNVSLFNLWTNMEMISQLNVYTNIQDHMYGCGKPGNILAWPGSNIGKTGGPFETFTKEKKEKISLICNKLQTDTYLIIPIQVKQQLANTFCRNLGKFCASFDNHTKSNGSYAF
jgi:hypothetical protein